MNRKEKARAKAQAAVLALEKEYPGAECSLTYVDPLQLLISVRLANACDLLLATRKSISEVASEVGYDNFSHFNVLFRKHMGCTPNAFRTQGRAESPRGLSGHSNLFLPREGEPGERSRA